MQLEKIIILSLIVLVMRYSWQADRGRWHRWWKRTKARLPRHWHPKSPLDCPHCRAGVKLQVARVNHQVVPWREQKSRRGAKKRLRTEGLACLNSDWPLLWRNGRAGSCSGGEWQTREGP